MRKISGIALGIVFLFLFLGGLIAASPVNLEDGAHTHPRYETLITDLQAVDATQNARLDALEQRTQIPATPRPTSTQAGQTTTPTQEMVQTIVPSSTPTATQAPTSTCITASGDFLAFTATLRRRSSPEIRSDNIYSNNISNTVAEPVCVSTLHTDANGYRWIQIAATRTEWTAVSRTVNGVTEYYGVLSDWDVRTSPFATDGNRLLLNGEIFKFTGVNFRELIGYDNRIMPYASSSDVAIQLDGADDLGMRVVRFYASHKSLTVEQAIPRVQNILNLLQARDMYAIIVLSDGAYSGFEIADNSTNRRVQGIDRYTHEFFSGGFRQNYLPYVEALTAAIGNHPAILAWEPINEATTINLSPTIAQMDAFLTFYAETAAVIRKNSSQKLISSGLESCWQLFVTNAYDGLEYCKQLYRIVDFGTLHTYESSNGQVLGSSYMHILREMQISNIPLIIEETNTFWSNETTDWLAALVKFAFSRLSGIMHWNMSFPYCRDIGVGDGAFNACVGTQQARRWWNITGFYRSLSDQLRLMY